MLTALKFNWSVPKDKISVKVEDGWVTLEGELGWNYQIEAARNAVSFLTGVKGVTNNIQIKSMNHDDIEEKDNIDSLSKGWALEDSDITVSVSGTTVTLTGTVNSWYQKEEAEFLASKTPGILHVKNELEVESGFETSID